MAEKKTKWIKTARWIYWTVTLLVVVGCMMSAGVTFLMHASFNAEGITHLGYPVYLLTILGAAKLLGGFAILQGRSRTLKELYIHPARSFCVASPFWRPLHKDISAFNHTCLPHDVLPAMEDWLEVRERA